MNLQLCGKKFRIFHLVVVLLCSSAIISFKMFVDTMLDSSANREVTLKDEFVQFDHNLSNTPTLIHPTSWHQKSKKKSIAIQHFSVGQLQVNLEYVKAHMQTNSRSGGFGAGCKIPPGGFKSWTRGTITKLTPIIHANCTLLFKGGDELEVAHVQLASYTWPVKEHALKFAKWVETHSCTDFKDELEGNLYTTKDEIDFPLAFAMLIHDSTFQVFRLLKVIYRPHNIYCIHYDNRSSEDMKLLVNKLAMCFDNIIIPDNFIPVQWGHHSLMDAQMKCFRELLRNRDKYPWRYVITLCGKELPLRTNNEIVQLLKQLKGNSAVRAFPVPKWEQKRYQTKWTVKSNTWIAPTKEDAGPVPYNLTVYKSMIYFALSPEFVNYTLNDEIAIALSEFLKDALIPEENFYSTLFMIPGVPGGYNASVGSLVPVVSTYLWVSTPEDMKEPYKCCRSGYIIHRICIMTSADLYTMSNNLKVNSSHLTGPMFHNKYFMERDHTVMDCIEEQLVIRNWLEYKNDCLD